MSFLNERTRRGLAEAVLLPMGVGMLVFLFMVICSLFGTVV
jgi:hypothetical protein